MLRSLLFCRFFTGHVARGLLLHFIRQVDPAASGLLHELNVFKPYSVTPLRFRSKNRTEAGYVLDPLFPCKVGFANSKSRPFFSALSPRNPHAALYYLSVANQTLELHAKLCQNKLCADSKCTV